MIRTFKTLAGAGALSCTLFLGFATPSPVGGNPVLTGHGEWEVPGATISFTVNAIELPDGSLQGHGRTSRVSEGEKGWAHFDVTDSLEFGGGLAVSGIISQVNGAPEELLGTQVILLVLDEGDDGSGADRAISAIGVPPELSLEDILFAPPPFGPPPPEFWFPLSAGNFKIH